MQLFDMHCHLGLMANGEDVAQQAKSCELTLLDTGVLPSEFETEQRRHAPNDSVYVACGLHPWWVTDTLKDSEIEQLIECARSYPLVGEVGLDFSNAHMQGSARQVQAFERLVTACSISAIRSRLISIHAVQSASNVLDILEANGTCQQANVIFHWFSGTGEDLTRARKLGCYFSINERMLQSRRGRAYAAQIEEGCLLLETDFPLEPGSMCTARQIWTSLNTTLEKLAQLRKTDAEALGEHIAQTSKRLLTSTTV